MSEVQTIYLDKVAFESRSSDRGYTVRADYCKSPAGDALVQIFKDGELVRRFLFPAYKVFNIAAHFSDIVSSEIEKNEAGYQMAAWDGFSGAVVIVPEVAEEQA